MSQSIPLLTVQDTVVAAAALVSDADRQKLDPRRAITGASSSAILSMAVLVGQFDRIAKAAAAAPPTMDQAGFTMTADEIARLADLRQQLAAAGYLPPSDIAQQEEPAHGEG